MSGKDIRKKMITGLIGRLKEIRDTAEIEQVDISNGETLESYETFDGRTYEKRGVIVTIAYKKLLEVKNDNQPSKNRKTKIDK